MEKHVQMVGILNLVYRAFMLLVGFFLLFLAAAFEKVFDLIVRYGDVRVEEIPMELLDFVPIILVLVGILIAIISTLGIIGAIGVLKRKEWGRILVLVISFFNLLRFPLGTMLGVYSIWILFNSETIKLFNPVPVVPPGA
jgi:hypothetical protein